MQYYTIVVPTEAATDTIKTEVTGGAWLESSYTFATETVLTFGK